MQNQNEPQDTPLIRQSLMDMSDQQIDLLVTRLRERRMAPIEAHKAAVLARKLYKDEQAREVLARKCELFEKQLARCESAHEKLEKYALDIRALRLQLE